MAELTREFLEPLLQKHYYNVQAAYNELLRAGHSIKRTKFYALVKSLGLQRPDVTKGRQLSISADTSSQGAQIAQIVAETLKAMGLVPPIPEPTPTPVPIPAPKPTKARTLIFTAWEIRVKPDEYFLDCLRQIAKRYDAQLYLVPVWPEDAGYIPESLCDFETLLGDLPINENLQFKYVPTHALVQSPVLGWGGGLETSAIIPGLIKDLQTLPAPHLSKQVMATGACGWLDAELRDYSHLQDNPEAQRSFSRRWSLVSNRRGGRVYAIAQQYTCPSALIVDLLDHKTFMTRYVSMPQRQDHLYDLNLKFTAYHSAPQVINPPALVLGDLHAADREETTYQAGLEMIRTIQPAAVVLNDAFDAMSCAKFERQDAATYQYAPTLTQEAATTIACLLEIAKLTPELIYLHSNHDDHLLDYLQNEDNYKSNRNYEAALKLQLYRIETGRHPITKLLRMDEIKNLTFVNVKEDRRIGKVLIKHGHEGISGKRQGFRPLAKVYNFYVDGHGHSPGVWRNAVRVGTTSNLRPSYAVGASGWLGANAIIHNDGSAQLLPILEGKWKL